MIGRKLSQKTALVVFVVLVTYILAMAVWWVVLMARLTDEKVDIATGLGADPEFVEQLQQQEISRQIMLGSEGVVFLVIILVGLWLIYRTMRQAERLRHRQENFLMSVTHELKTPLASMGVYLETLQSAKIPPEKKQAAIPRMKQDLKRLDRLVEDILEAGRFDSSDYHPPRDRLELGSLLNKVADNLENRGHRVEVRLLRQIEEGVFVQANSSAMTRAIETVLDNAVKYSGGEPVEIKISLRREGSRTQISIRDNGVGIERKELDFIFDRFYRVGRELTRASQGTGLGLYLCREIVRAHGGRIRAKSEGVGRGTEFLISLPLDETE
jgi:signal transduction histidine kinase